MSKIAIVLSGADFSTLGLGQVTLNLGTKYSVTYPSDKHYSVSPTNVYGDSSATIRVIPNSGYTFVSADATSTPSAPTITMGGVSVPCSLEGEYYVARISSVSGNIVVSGGSATTKAPTYTIALNLTNITASLSNGGSAINSVDVKQGGSKVVYLSTTGNYVLPSSFSNTGTNCTINFTRTSDTQGTITITASGNGSITASGVYVERPTWELTEETTRNTGYGSTNYIDTNIAPFTNGLADFAIMCKFKPSNVDAQSNYLTASYPFGVYEASGTGQGVYMTNTPEGSGTTARLSCYYGGNVSFTPQIVEYIVYISAKASENKVYYKLYDATNSNMVVEGYFEPNASYTSSKTNYTLKVAGANYNSYNLGFKGTIHNFRYYDKFISADSDVVTNYFSN